jgi:benzodiazapine receptor
MNPTTLRSAIALVFFLAMCFGVAWIGSMFTFLSVGTWYQSLTKPDWTPPDWVFGPVWSLLYTMIAVAGWRVWRRGGLRGAEGPLALFSLQLVLNAAWSGLFFGLQRPDWAFVEIVALWGIILTTLVAFWRLDWRSGALFVPYLIWVSYAAALNFAIWRLNP